MPTETMRSNVSDNGSIIPQLELHAVLQPLGRGAGPRFGELLLRQRDAGDMCAEVARQGQRHAAPAATDIQHAQSRPVQAQLGGDVPLLRGLRLLQRFVTPREIGAGVLPVPIEEQAVEATIQIVVMRHIAPCPAGRVVLHDPAADVGQVLAQA